MTAVKLNRIVAFVLSAVLAGMILGEILKYGLEAFSR